MNADVNRLTEGGQKDGLWIEADDAGASTGYYAAGYREGLWPRYEGRVLRKLIPYSKGVRKGIGYVFNGRGGLAMTVEFDNDRIHGLVEFFSTDQERLATYRYIYDKLSEVLYYVPREDSPSKSKDFVPEI
jgi:antitoxin component YwqK of YwqJK toxin-antitoxin module